MKICSFVGEQPKDFPWEYGKNQKAHAEYIKQLQEAIENIVEFDEITTFCCGMAYLTDLDFAEAVLYKKENKYPNIMLICLADTESSCKDWDKQNIERYQTILRKADEQQPYTDIPLIDKSEQVIVVWNEKPSGTVTDLVHYAIEQGKFTYFIRLNDIKMDTDEPNGKLKRELKEHEESEKRNLFTRIAYMLLIQELIKTHPNPKEVFKKTIKNNSYFERYLTLLASTLELDLED